MRIASSGVALHLHDLPFFLRLLGWTGESGYSKSVDGNVPGWTVYRYRLGLGALNDPSTHSSMDGLSAWRATVLTMSLVR